MHVSVKVLLLSILCLSVDCSESKKKRKFSEEELSVLVSKIERTQKKVRATLDRLKIQKKLIEQEQLRLAAQISGDQLLDCKKRMVNSIMVDESYLQMRCEKKERDLSMTHESIKKFQAHKEKLSSFLASVQTSLQKFDKDHQNGKC